MINVLEYTSNQLSKFRAKNLLEITDKSRGRYNVNSQIKFKSAMLKSNFCDQGDAYILAKGKIALADTSAADANASNTNKKVIFKNCAPFSN